jgi:pyridoxal phosphate enzyme (YggS family)
MSIIKENLSRCLERIETAALKIGKNGSEITLVAVSKMVEPVLINAGIEAGIRNIGENKVQEAQVKKEFINPVMWHMVGHLQTNKVKQAVRIFDAIQSVDSYHLAEEINKRCIILQKNMPVLLEVNTSGEPSKFGCEPAEALSLVTRISSLPNIRIKGLMTVGIFSSEKEKIRKCFIILRQLAEKISTLKMPNVDINVLSMGMSGDFEIAIEEGSTMVRIGTAIFGAREYGK